MPPKKDNKGKQFFRIGTAAKDAIPATVKNLPREGRPLKYPEQSNKQIIQEYTPIADPEEWNEEQNFNEIPITKFDIESDRYAVFWRRPRQFLRKRFMIESDAEPPLMINEEIMFNDDTYQTRVETKEKIDYMVNQIESELLICESYERAETQEEYEIRKREFQERQAQAAQKKKGAKKGPDEVFDENIQQVKDVRLSDVNCTEDMPEASRWIASQLQIIKDRGLVDSNTGRPLSNKIFPQKDGAPVYNPQGKYVVKLYYMGKERKIVISDHMPVDFRGNPLLPNAGNQLWPLIMSKAVLQLAQQTKYSLVGDGFVMYALLGFLTESIDLKTNSWQLIDSIFNDQRDGVIQVYGFETQSKQNIQQKSRKEYQIETIRNQNKETENYERPHKPFIEVSVHEEPIEIKQSEPQPLHISQFKRSSSVPKESNSFETNIRTCYGYSIVEQFQNENFNMVYAQKRTERELRLRQEYFDICKTPMNKMNKEEKLEYRRKKKEIKERLADDDKRRIALITQQPVKHRLLRLKSNGHEVKVFCPFAAEEIYIAKKCIANKLNKPPNYDLPELKGDDKSVVSQQVKDDQSFSVKALDDFTSVQNAQEPAQFEEGGWWIHEKEFLSFFESIQISYDPKKMMNYQVTQVPCNVDQEFTNYENMEMLIVSRDPDKEETAINPFIIGFSPKQSSNINMDDQVRPYALLQRFDLETFESIIDYKLLNQAMSAQMLLLDNKNHIFRMNIYSPLNFTILMASNTKVSTLSICDYLTDYENYQTQKFSIDYPAIESNKFYVYFRFRIVATSPKEMSSFVFKIKSTNDGYLLRNLRLKLCETPPEGVEFMQSIEGLHKNLFESEALLQASNRFTVSSGVQYHFILDGSMPYNTQEGTLEMEFLHNNELQVQLLEQVEPLRYSDKYLATKYGVLFRERILSQDTVASVHFKLAEGIAQQAQVNAKASKKGGGPDVEIIETELKVDRLIILEIIKQDKVIQYHQGLNNALLSNIVLTKDDVYYLQGRFDLREWPEAIRKSEETDSLYWFLTVFSADTVVLVKDTSKEDRDKAIKKSWEDKEPGRAANAKKSRAKFLISLKDNPTEEELQILNQPRLTKRQREEEAKQATQKKAPKKEDKKGAKATKVEIVEVVQRVFPKSENHVNEAINQFLVHLEADRLKDQFAEHSGLINVRSDVQKREIVEAIMMAREEVAAIIARNLKMREEIKIMQKDNKEILLQDFNTKRTAYKEALTELFQLRDKAKNDMSALQKKEQTLIDLCKQEKVGNPEDIEKLIADSQIDPALITAGKQQIQNWKVAIVQEKLITSLQNFDIEAIKAAIDQITQLSIEGIDTTAAEDMLDEAASNPNFVAEKQAELKKQGKKPAKK